MITDPTNNTADRKIVCAAIRYPDGFIAVGSRHYSPAMRKQLKDRYGNDHTNVPKEIEQGFLNTWDEFRNREQAYETANRLGQIITPDRDRRRNILYSEDLY